MDADVPDLVARVWNRCLDAQAFHDRDDYRQTLVKALASDRVARDRLVQAHVPWLSRLAGSFLGRTAWAQFADVEDLTYETLLKFLQTFPSDAPLAPNPLAAVCAYLKKTMQNLAIDAGRRASRRTRDLGSADADLVATRTSVQTRLARADDWKRVFLVVRKTRSQEARDLIHYRGIDGESFTALSARLGKSEAALRQAWSRLREELRSSELLGILGNESDGLPEDGAG